MEKENRASLTEQRRERPSYEFSKMEDKKMRIRDNIILFLFGWLVVFGIAAVAETRSPDAGPDAPSFLEWCMTID